MVHELKTLPCYFRATLAGTKNFEIRRNSDRGFQAGDTVILREWDPKPDKIFDYTGAVINAKITYVTNFEQKGDYVVFGFEVAEQ